MSAQTGPVRCAVVGAGWWATHAHIPALLAHEGAELVAVVDSDPARSRDAAQAAEGALALGDIEELISADVGVEAVVVATPHSTHHEVVGVALDAGLHVLVEKPLALTASEAKDLLERSRRAGRHLLVGYTSQYTSVARDVRRLLTSGHLGELAHVVVEFASGTAAMFAAARSGDETATPAADAATYTAEHGGGQASTQLTHALGFLLWATALQAEEVFAYTANRGLPVDVVDAFAFRLEGGVPGVASSTGTAVEEQPGRQRVTCYGTEGWIEHDLITSRAAVHKGGVTRTLEVDRSLPAYPIQAPAQDLIDLIRHGGEPCAPAGAAAATVALIEAAHAAARARHPQPVPRCW